MDREEAPSYSTTYFSMKRTLLILSTTAAWLVSGCEKPEPDNLKKPVAELEQQSKAAERRAEKAEETTRNALLEQKELQRKLEEQQVAIERDELERERRLIELRITEIERIQDERDAAAAAELRERETRFEEKEQSLATRQSALNAQQELMDQKAGDLAKREQEMAGREAIGDTENDPGPDFNVNSVDFFYDTLIPYGSWFHSPDYGYVWRPAIAGTVDWRPYTRGRWTCTNRGWMWLSDEPFGWATYHYGRWARCRTNGWLWVPGIEWAPSWACWRTGGSHIGWAPLPPETLAYRGRIWDASVEVTFGIGSSWFCFVEASNFCRPIYTHCIPIARHSHFWGNTTNITYIHTRNDRVISGGPRYGDVQRQTRTRPSFYRIEESRNRRPGSLAINHKPYIRDGRVSISKPRREESRNPDARLNNRPSRVSGTFDRINVDRNKPVSPRIRDDFRRNRNLDARTGDIASRPKKPSGSSPGSTRIEEPRRITQTSGSKGKTTDRPDDRPGSLPHTPQPVIRTTEKQLPTGVTRGRSEEIRDRSRLVINTSRRTDSDSGNTPPIAHRQFKSKPEARSSENSGNQGQSQQVERRQERNDEPSRTKDKTKTVTTTADRSSGKSSSGSKAQQQRYEEIRRRNEASDAQRRQLEAAQRQRIEQQRQQQNAERQRQESRRRMEESRQRAEKAAQENARREQQRRAAQENAKREQQRRAAKENAKREQQRRAAQENARREQQRRATQENARRQQQQRQMEEQRRRSEQSRRNNRKNR